MNWLVYHIASGHAFFTGIALVILAAVASIRSTPVTRRITVFALLIGVIAIAVSSTAIPYWYYAILLAAMLLWAASAMIETWRRWSIVALVAACFVAVALEIPYHIRPIPVLAAQRSLAVIGDSVTAGMDGSDKSETWPNILARQHHLTIQDISHPGETAASALRRVKRQPVAAPVVLLEIGGNDLLGSTASSDFSRDLDALLSHVCAPGRQVILLELPLPPFRHEYGRIQRALARKHNVLLVPKRVFLSVLAASDSTVDTIHLTQVGHRRMAAAMWRILRSAFPE